MKRILILAIAVVGIAGCSPGREEDGSTWVTPAPSVAVVSASPALDGRPAEGGPDDAARCLVARSVPPLSERGAFRQAGEVVALATDARLAGAGGMLAGLAADGSSASGGAIYQAWLDLLEECLRVAP